MTTGSGNKQKKGPPCLKYPQSHSLTLRRVSGRSGRDAYENSKKLEVLTTADSSAAMGTHHHRRLFVVQVTK